MVSDALQSAWLPHLIISLILKIAGVCTLTGLGNQLMLNLSSPRAARGRAEAQAAPLSTSQQCHHPPMSPEVETQKQSSF